MSRNEPEVIQRAGGISANTLTTQARVRRSGATGRGSAERPCRVASAPPSAFSIYPRGIASPRVLFVFIYAGRGWAAHVGFFIWDHRFLLTKAPRPLF